MGRQRRAAGLGDLACRGGDVESGAERALAVVAMGDRRAEESHDRIADMLVDAAAIERDDRFRPGIEGLDQAAQILGIEPCGKRGEAREIGEENGDLAPFAHGLRRRAGAGLLGRRRGLGLGPGFAAAAAEARAGLIDEVAIGTGPAQLGATAGAELAAFAILFPAAPATHEVHQIRAFRQADFQPSNRSRQVPPPSWSAVKLAPAKAGARFASRRDGPLNSSAGKPS